MDLLQWQLTGLPTAVAAVGGAGRRLVVADDAAGIYLLDLTGQQPVHIRISTSGPLSAPSTLCFLPAPAEAAKREQQQGGRAGGVVSLFSGVLFVGSACGSSQAVGVPHALAPPPAAAASSAAGEAAPAAAPWPVLQSALLPSLAPALCLASIPAGSGPDGAPEAQLLVGCGRAPRGRLARVRSGVGLRPFVLDGPELPGGVSLFPVAANPSSPNEHSLLLISLEGAARGTLALSLAAGSSGGEAVCQIELPGLDSSRPCLWAGGAAGGWVVQVTEASVRVVSHSTHKLAHEWMSPHGEYSYYIVIGGGLVGRPMLCQPVHPHQPTTHLSPLAHQQVCSPSPTATAAA